jgi:hypothetical protein
LSGVSVIQRDSDNDFLHCNKAFSNAITNSNRSPGHNSSGVTTGSDTRVNR